MSSRYDQRRLERVDRRLEELRAWRNAREQIVPDWTFTGSDGMSVPIAVGDFWPTVETPVHFSGHGMIPPDWAGEPVELELWLGGEGFVQVTGGVGGGLNPLHHTFPITEAARGGESVSIEAEVVPKGLFGSHIAEPRVERAHLVIPARETRALERDLAMIAKTVHLLPDHDVAPRLLAIAEAALAITGSAWPSATDIATTRLVLGHRNPIGRGSEAAPANYAIEGVDADAFSGAIWHMPPARRALEPLPESAVSAIQQARQEIATGLDALKREYPPVGSLLLTGHAHIDLAWLWPVAETRRKGRRTFATVLDLMDRYPDFTFNQSSAQLYAWIEQDAPELFAQVKQRVAEGRWETIGGSWVEPDCEVTGGEAFVRQLFYGQRAFAAWFGKRSTVAWLPDVFGFSGAIPQLLRGAGISGFFTIKLNWNEENRFPHDLFTWTGIDGSQVTANMFRNLPPAHGYNGNIDPVDTLGTWRNFDGKRYYPESLLAFGWGDGAGGPTAKMLENYARIKEFPALPRLHMGLIEEYFAALPPSGLPVWTGELYLEFHRGTLTSQARTKHLNRQAEHRLLEAEVFAAIANLHGFDYPRDELETAWKSLLLNQFHDILPGSSIAEVYADTEPELEAVVETATAARDAALAFIGAGSEDESARDSLLVANASLAPRPLTVLMPATDAAPAAFSVDGVAVPVQVTDDGLLLHDPARSVPGLGWLTLAASGSDSETVEAPGAVRVEAASGGAILENDLLRVEIGADGTLHRVIDKAANDREVLADRGNQLWAFVDKPRTYDAWDIEENYEQAGAEVGGVESVTIVEHGPLRGAVRVVRNWRDTRINQTYRLLAGSRRLDIATEIEWHERQMYLQARFPLAVHAHEATYETMYGVVKRPTHRNTSWDAARFEVSAHRFADISEPGYGVALLNDAKYGYSAHGHLLTISLLRGPMYPDPNADEGEHHFTYALFPHLGDWTTAGVVDEAFALNSPLIAVAAAGTAGATAANSLVSCSSLPLALGAMKPAEDGAGLILRLYEPHGARGRATLSFSGAVVRVERVNLLEEPAIGEQPEPAVVGDRVTISMRPFEVVTLRVVFGDH